MTPFSQVVLTPCLAHNGATALLEYDSDNRKRTFPARQDTATAALIQIVGLRGSPSLPWVRRLQPGDSKSRQL